MQRRPLALSAALIEAQELLDMFVNAATHHQHRTKGSFEDALQVVRGLRIPPRSGVRPRAAAGPSAALRGATGHLPPSSALPAAPFARSLTHVTSPPRSHEALKARSYDGSGAAVRAREEGRYDGEEGGGGGGGGSARLSRAELLLKSLRRRGVDVELSQLEDAAEGNRSHRCVCPTCQGGSREERSLSLTVAPDYSSVVYNCFRGTCGWKGAVYPDGHKWTSHPSAQRDSDAAAAAAPSPPPTDAEAMFLSRGQATRPPVVPTVDLSVPLSEQQRNWFRERGISDDVVARNMIFADRGGTGADGVYCPTLQSVVEEAICFPYLKDNKVVNIKYRALPKHFWQVRGAEKVLFGYDSVRQILKEPGSTKTIILVEGELDKMACNQAGLWNVMSVPDGAPAKVRQGDVPAPEEDRKFSYLWSCKDVFELAETIILATDADEPGQALAEELARRLGRERCRKVSWPKSGPDRRKASQRDREASEVESLLSEFESKPEMQGGLEPLRQRLEAIEGKDVEGGARKDANEVLLMDGPEALLECINAAGVYPVAGLYRFTDFWDEIQRYYEQRVGDETGMSTGWRALDPFYRVVPGELTIITGVPNSGKSEWLDALMINLSEMHGWGFALCSMEKRVQDHARQLLEKKVRKPFFNNTFYGRGFGRMTPQELHDGLAWIDDRFCLIRFEDDALPSVDWVLDKARAAVFRHGIRGLVIDPYNELDHARPRDVTETEYVSQLLTKLKRFAQHHDVHVWFVAHPRQLRDWKGGAPNLYDISGSANFINKCDNGIVIHRNRDKDASPEERRRVEILVRKVRNKAAGTIGDAGLVYDFLTGRYEDAEGGGSGGDSGSGGGGGPVSSGGGGGGYYNGGGGNGNGNGNGARNGGNGGSANSYGAGSYSARKGPQGQSSGPASASAPSSSFSAPGPGPTIQRFSNGLPRTLPPSALLGDEVGRYEEGGGRPLSQPRTSHEGHEGEGGRPDPYSAEATEDEFMREDRE